MKKIFKEAMRRYQNWRYRRLYRKLFWFYAKIKIDGDAAGQNAAEAFKWLTAIGAPSRSACSSMCVA